MLKKRILASSMASVMALSSVSLVAFADTKDYGEAVSEAELKEYVASFEKFIEDELDNYGSIQADNFRQAIDHANTVLDDSDADAADYTAAYQMIKSVYDRRVIISNDQLKALVKDNQGKYDKNNILNEDFQDNTYDKDTYAEFKSAFENAEFYVDSGDSRGITDSYLKLEAAVKGLKELDPITKSDFRTALAAYEQLELKMKNYETWRRGTISVAPTTGKEDNKTAKDKLVGKSCVVTMADLKNMVYGTSTGSYKYLDKTQATGWNTYTPTGTLIGGFTFTGTLKDAIKAKGDYFATAKTVVKTTDPDIKAAYDAAVEAVAVFNGWTPDKTTSGGKGPCATLLQNYNAQLVELYNKDFINVMIGASTGTALPTAKATKLHSTFGKTASQVADITFTYDPAAHTLKADKEYYIILKNGKIVINGGAVTPALTADFAKEETGLGTLGDNETAQKIAVGTDLLQYASYNISSATDLDKAIKGYKDYLGADFDPKATTPGTVNDAKTYMQGTAAVIGSTGTITTPAVPGLADGKTIATCTGSPAEWLLVWRKLNYALTDQFPTFAPDKAITLSMLQAKIKEAYAITDKTGDAALFATQYGLTVAAREKANEFLAAAKATNGYKPEMGLIINNTASAAPVYIKDIYKTLDDNVSELTKWWNDFQYSYGEIRDTIGKIGAEIDAGTVSGDELVKALDQCAFDLSVLEPSDVNGTIKADSNMAFDYDRTFIDVNRLKTGKSITGGKDQNAEEKALVASYAALIKAYEAAKKGTAEGGYDLDNSGGAPDMDDLQYMFDNFVLKQVYDAKLDFNSDKIVDMDDLTLFFNTVILG